MSLFTYNLPVFLTEPLLDNDVLAEETAGVEPGLSPLLDQGELVQVNHPLVVDEQLPAQPGGVAEHEDHWEGGRHQEQVVGDGLQHRSGKSSVL